MLIPWNIREGKVVELKTQTGTIIKVDPPVDMETVNELIRSFGKDLEPYFRVNSHLRGRFTPEDLNSYLRVHARLQGISLIAPRPTTPPIPQAPEPPRPEIPGDRFRVPEHLVPHKTPYVYVPRRAAYAAWTVLEAGAATRKDIHASHGWKAGGYADGLSYALLVSWREKGLITNDGSVYKAREPVEGVKAYCAAKGVDITAVLVGDQFWVPGNAARPWLDHLADQGWLKRHADGERFSVAKMPEPAPPPGSLLKGGEAAKGYGGGPQNVMPVRIPAPETFTFEKKDITCDMCAHNYGHGYVSGNVKICGGCYIKIGGKTTHGEGRTITNR